ncbi:MAG: phosphoribosylaminoimidazolecarboxamide formyltransferase [Alphaproteobacteria bacterium]|nr:phosphoribosylaminoimidazolecarboxamide formyltransferase [Alphaproteobacteria bacterium]
MADDKNPEALRELDARLTKAREGDTLSQDRPHDLAGPPPQTAMGVAFRVSVEIISAVAVGVGIGWGIDYLLGSDPWGLVVFTLLGGVAGMLNVYRLAKGFGYAAGYRQPDANTDTNTDTKKDR